MYRTWTAAETVDKEDVRWYYMAKCGDWHLFEVNPSQQCPLTNRDIERNYRRNSNGFMEYRIADCTYRLDFSEMKQINVTTAQQRPIKRRFVGTPLHPVPSHWDLPVECIHLDSDTQEWENVVKKFAKTMPDVPIRSIRRVQNFKLWESFCRKKVQLMEIKQMPIDERMLFHGTPNKNIQSICLYNFDMKFAGSNGSVYGRGIYFAKKASKSKKYCGVSKSRNGVSPSKTMILARVLVGEYTEGDEWMRRAPPKDRTKTSFYDSCVDYEIHPKIFVVFNSNQVYPEYLINFYDGNSE